MNDTNKSGGWFCVPNIILMIAKKIVKIYEVSITQKIHYSTHAQKGQNKFCSTRVKCRKSHGTSLPRREQVVHTIPHMAQVVTSTAFEQQLL